MSRPQPSERTIPIIECNAPAPAAPLSLQMLEAALSAAREEAASLASLRDQAATAGAAAAQASALQARGGGGVAAAALPLLQLAHLGARCCLILAALLERLFGPAALEA